MTDKSYRDPSAAERPTAPTGEVTVRAIRTPAPAAPPTPPVQVRPVWRSEAKPVSLEDLQRAVVPQEAPAVPAPVATQPQPAPSPQRPTRPMAASPAAPVSPRPVSAPAPAPTATSGWLSHALQDFGREEPTPTNAASRPVREAAPSPSSLPPFLQSAPTAEADTVQVIRAGSAPQPSPSPTAPLSLQEALASDLLPDLPVELLERLWAQEQAAQEQAVQEQTAHAPVQAQEAPQHWGGVQETLFDLPPSQSAAPVPTGAQPSAATVEPKFPGAAPFLARFLPLSAPQQLGLNARFCDLHAFLKYLHELNWYGYIHVGMGDLGAQALVYEGRVVAAAAVNASGEQALGELLSLYEQGATMSTYPLPPAYAHALSGVGSRAWQFDLTPDFTGVYADPEGALFYVRGEVVAAMPVGLPYEGAFPAPQRPETLILPRSFAGWAHQPYVATLRGRDANNPITSVYHEFRAKYGEAGAQFIRALASGQTPAEYAIRTDAPLHDLEEMLLEFTQGGYLKEP